MSSNRLWMIGLAVAIVAVLGLGWLVGVAPQLAAVDAANAQRQTVQQQNEQATTALAKLKSDYAGIDDLKAKLATLQQSVPGSAELNTFVKQLISASSTSQATVSSITISDAQPYAPPAPAAAAAPAAGASTATPTPAPTAAPTAAPAAAAPPAPLPPELKTNPKVTGANFIAIPVAVGLKGSYSNVLAFTKAAQSGSRLFLVNKFTSTASTASAATKPPAGTDATNAQDASSSVTATLSGFVYVFLYSDSATPTPAPAG
jgi:Tfp pilus assembly protein PilO